MTLKEIANVLNAKVVVDGFFDKKAVVTAVASDLMSDVLTLDEEPDILITGLTNLQSIRTAEFADIPIVVVARGKKLTPEFISLAKETELCLLTTDFSVFKSSGVLYKNGVKEIY
ncbi:MAG: hypothetical protein KAG96_02370 [Ichthyobacteriaceae bacterium]|nr:hypothetical protein [Ichthyobacteriaceae bacterium]